MASFALALPYVLRHEGGWSDDPDDPGGATMHGITLETAKRHGITTKEALRAITPEQEAAIYREDYWRFDGIESQRVATKLFDMAVNMGLRTAVKLLQRGLEIQADGVFGPKTEFEVNHRLPDVVLEILVEESRRHYLDICIARPKSKKYLDGWMARANEVPQREKA